jgi:hypothetical protein
MQPLVLAPVRMTVSTPCSVRIETTGVPKKIDGAFLTTQRSPSRQRRSSTSTSHEPSTHSSMHSIFHGGRSARSDWNQVAQKMTGAAAERAAGSRRARWSTAEATSGLRPIGASGRVTAFCISTTRTAGRSPKPTRRAP